ncbi:putative tungstate transport system substrate-binding protein [Proteiniborus sp. DW1]|uniref:substrate-binding domain-containing protein n=1 Tax=Proteiniborus sp. DW1 TaxID=1889883 RepID=UPI00092E0633|nr:substrate-binding domain-containing protein [Proteiniborus sp. DW1]SCG84550.1 putative tungstate transport system substrate-binding protein [Proteiniborus sp. DW1]
MKKFLLISLSILLVFSLLVGCTPKSTDQPENSVDQSNGNRNDNEEKLGGSIILSTTTSTQDSKLLDYLLPKFTEDTGIEVKVIAVGTGKALQMGKDGDADILLVHAKASEEEFVKEGHGTERHDVMYNDFILVGPKDDPLKLKENSPNDILTGLTTISENQAKFVSRGDDSGTHKKELEIWKTAGIEPQGDWYLSAGSGMGDVLKIASEKQGYTLTDRATYLSLRDTLDLDIIIEKDENLFNQYGIIPVNPEKSDKINAEGAKAFMDWMLSEKGQKLIGEFGVDKYGMPLFVPNGK